MQQYVELIVVGVFLVGLGALIVARVRQRRLIPVILLWLLAPAIPMAVLFALGALFSPAAGTALYGLVFAIMLIGTIILVPWLVVGGIGVAIGLALRRRRPPELPVPATPQQTLQPIPSVMPSSVPQNRLVDGALEPHFSQTSPDGSIRVDIEPVEWASSQFANTPRVVEIAGGRILCDLLGSDWEAHVSFPRDRYVWLGLRRYRSPGYLFAEFDLDADRYRIALSALENPDEEGQVGDISERLEFWWQRATANAASRADKETPTPARGPFAAWRIALVILIAALGAIAGLTYLSMTYGIEPPSVRAFPHIPRLPG